MFGANISNLTHEEDATIRLVTKPNIISDYDLKLSGIDISHRMISKGNIFLSNTETKPFHCTVTHVSITIVSIK